MTLCAAWVREVDNEQELIFATDSCLSCGDRWHSGVKLFELPRKDCLICFAGDTNRTYPLILNLISSIKFDEHLANTHTDISEVLDYLTQLFTDLCNSISNFEPQTFAEALGDFQFLFGGWSWKANSFKLWKLSYNHALKAITHDEANSSDMVCTFIGDELETAESSLNEELVNRGRIRSRSFDMEPFSVLVNMIRKNEFSGIDGAVQLAKIHPPGSTEFLGVYWPFFNNGKKTFLGKDVSVDNNPAVRFVDPDTAEVVENALPDSILDISEALYGNNVEFLNKCYPNGEQKTDLTKREKANLKDIFEQVAYSQFLALQVSTEGDDL
ncbi:hypothetical protein [Shewanella frigidimarina]|uniref:hypothetical protein n=1 Tax=Shewanella frigidimarina TaxID=56812 RepID=UPI000F4EF0D5|nr:hypothetical protein [Shewanella frigidimarina]RPA36048.1 hypothetical protein EGC78_03515 [Shewanella frigidimarina]